MEVSNGVILLRTNQVYRKKKVVSLYSSALNANNFRVLCIR